MKKFEQALTAVEQKNNLKKVRLKLDPKIREAQDYSQYDGYEGYIISETPDAIRVQLIGGKQIDIPLCVLEGKLTDFIKGASPGLYNAGAAVRDKYRDVKDAITDPNVSKATKAGKFTGAAVRGAAKLLNPFNTLRVGAKIMSAPAEALGKLVGVNQQQQQQIVQQGETTKFGVRDVSGSEFGNFLQKSVQAIVPNLSATHTITSNVSYFSIGDETQKTPAQNTNYVVIGGARRVPIPGSRYSGSNVIPFGNSGAATSALISQLKNPKTLTLDNTFAQNLNVVTTEIEKMIPNHDISKKIIYDFKVLHVPSFKIIDIPGYITEIVRSGRDFTLSEEFPKRSS